MSDVSWRADCHYRARLRNVVSSGEHRGTTKGVADQDSRGGMIPPQVGGSTEEILNIGREVRIGKLPL